MLILSGNSERAFAADLSINANPLAWVEWNYNMISKPYVVVSSSTGPISAPNLNSSSGWSSKNGGEIYPAYIAGHSTEANPTPSGLYMSTSSTSFSDTFSSSISVTSGSGYYKMVFYVRADISNSVGQSPAIPSSSISLYNSTVGSGNTYYYRVVPVSPEGHGPMYDSNNNDVASIQTPGPWIDVIWNYSGPATQFDLYRGTNVNFMPYVNTVAKKKKQKINLDPTMESLDNSINWTGTASTNVSPNTIIYKHSNSAKIKSQFNSFQFPNTWWGWLGAFSKDRVGLFGSPPRTVFSAYSNASITFMKDSRKGQRFAMGSDLNLANNTQYTFGALVLNNYTPTTSGSITLKISFYTALTGGSLISTSAVSVPISSTSAAWYSLSQTFTASSSYFVEFNITDSSTYQFTQPTRPDPLAIDAIGLFQGTEFPSVINSSGNSYNQKWSTSNLLNDSSERYIYSDNISNSLQYTYPAPLYDTKFSLVPAVRLSSAGNYLENTKYYCRTYDEKTNMPQFAANSIDFDGSKFQKIELVFGADTNFDVIEIDMNMIASHINSEMIFSKPEIFKIDAWNFFNWQYNPIESPFEPFRPGEALLHPYLPSSDLTISNQSLGSVGKPVSNIFYNVNKLLQTSLPYKQQFYSIYNKFKYYISDEPPSNSNPLIIMARYNNYMNVNKIVVKASNALTDMTLASGSIQLLGPNNSVMTTISYSPSAFNSNGIMTIYYDGLNWSTSRGAWTPPKLTDSGILQNVTSSVNGVTFILNSTLQLSSYASKLSTNANKNIPAQAHIVEISPRLEVDVSDLVKSFSTEKSIDDSETAAGFPIGYMNSNSGKLELSNIPVYKNSFPHTIFDNISSNATFSNLLKQGIKFTVGLVSPVNDFTEYVPFMTMYSDSWSINDLETVSVELFDSGRAQFQSIEAPDYFGWTENIFNTATNLLDACGFSDYDYDQLKNIMLRKSRMTSYFWCEKEKSLFDVLKAFFVAHQIGAAFDEYGILRFYDLDQYIYNTSNYDFKPEFLVSDVPATIDASTGNTVNYEANMVQGTYSPTIDKKIGKIIFNYKIPNPTISADADDKLGKKTITSKAAFSESTDVGLIKSAGNRSVLFMDRSIYTDTAISWAKASPNTIGNFNGQAFLQGELIAWRGIEFKFSPESGTNQFSPFTKTLFSPGEINSTIQDLIASNSNLRSVNYDFTGKLVGVSRGNKMTSIRNHYMYDDAAKASTRLPGHYLSTDSTLSQYFKKVQITRSGQTAISGTNSIKLDKNVAKFVVQKTSTRQPIVLIPQSSKEKSSAQVPSSASNFSFFTATFTGPDYRKQKFAKQGDHSVVEVGFYFKHSSNDFMIGLRNVDNKTKLFVNQYSDYFVATKDLNKIYDEDSPIREVHNVFDGKKHRISVDISYVNATTDNLVVYVDNKYYGTYRILTPGLITTLSKSKMSDWGIYVQNLQTKFMSTKNDEKPINVNVHEMYAMNYEWNKQWMPHEPSIYSLITSKNAFYHWNNPAFLNKLLKNDPNAEPPYFYWGPMILSGFYEYNKHDFGTAPIFPSGLEWNYDGYDPGNWDGVNAKLGRVISRDITKSSIFANPFRFSAAFSSNSWQLVFLSKADNNIGSGQIKNISIDAPVFSLSDQMTLERVINPANIQNTVTLSSDWIQSPSEAEEMMSKISKMVDKFNTEIRIQIFGNPLIQVGDTCQLIYTLKEIGYSPDAGIIPTYFIVKSVEQNFSGGLETSLTLRPLFDQSFSKTN